VFEHISTVSMSMMQLLKMKNVRFQVA